MKAVILAGGKGTRLGSVCQDIPKPMVPIAGKPLIEHQILLLKRYGITEIILSLGHLGNIIEEYFTKNSIDGVAITYFHEPKPLGTAGAVKLLEKELNQSFIVLYGDLMIDIDLNRFINFHNIKNVHATLLVHPNDHPYDSDLVEIDKNNFITKFHSKPHNQDFLYQNLVNAAVYILSPQILEDIPSNKPSDFGKDIFPLLLTKNAALAAYNTPEYVKDMGSPDRLQIVEKDFLIGKVQRRNLCFKQKAIFLDRDGVINYAERDLYKLEQFKLLPDVVKAIKFINRSDYLCIVVTNQPVIAKGFCTEEELKEIHKKMETDLGKEGAKIDAIYYCPHHPEKGHQGEIKELKIECSCRKPNNGMILTAKKDFNIDLEKSYLIGDHERDIEAAVKSNVTSILVARNQEQFMKIKIPTKKSQTLYDAVTSIIREENDNLKNPI